jgi:hypothetical protein
MPVGPKPSVPLRIMRNSERQTFRRCQQQHEYSYTSNYGPQVARGPLVFGTGIHYGLEKYYPVGRKRGVHPAKTFTKWYEEHERQFDQWDDEGNKIDALELGVGMLEGYVKEYGKDDFVDVIAPEMVFQVHIYDYSGNYLYTWVGTQDLCYVDLSKSSKRRKRISFMEHKTTKNAPPASVDLFSPYGEQGYSYWCGGTLNLRQLGLIPEDQCVDSVNYNWLKKALPSTKKTNSQGHTVNKPSKASLTAWLTGEGNMSKASLKGLLVDDLIALIDGVEPQGAHSLLGEISKVQPGILFLRDDVDFGDYQLDQMIDRVTADAWQILRTRQGKLPVHVSPQDACSWCDFKDVCELRVMGGDWQAVLATEFVYNNPNDDYGIDPITGEQQK